MGDAPGPGSQAAKPSCGRIERYGALLAVMGCTHPANAWDMRSTSGSEMVVARSMLVIVTVPPAAISA
jgi:hypothetical protein